MGDERQDRQQTQKTSSKYDFVKVRVWLADHYYTFSRFLVSRVLTVTQVPCQSIPLVITILQTVCSKSVK
jgi:hypothetical protein